MKKYIILCMLLAQYHCSFSQLKKVYRSSVDDSTLQQGENFTLMPYNRLIESAGKVVTYGNKELENHALDLTVLPDNKSIAIEDRYGIAILDAATQKIICQWSFTYDTLYKNLMSTYSGIKSFAFNGKDYIVWSASNGGDSNSYIMIAVWDGFSIKHISSIQCKATAPAATALPNEVAVRIEAGVPYLYAVLNGNNQLLKIRFADKQIVWTAATGVAPFGLRIIANKVYVTNWAGAQVTDLNKENAGTPWGSAYTNPVTGATLQGSLSVIDATNGTLLNELQMGLHPNAIINSADNHYLYISNGNSDFISVVDVQKEKVIDSINVGLFSKYYAYYGSSPNALAINEKGTMLYVANGMDNAVCVVQLGKNASANGTNKTAIKGYIPTEAYPSGIAILGNMLYVTNLEAKGARVLSDAEADLKSQKAFSTGTFPAYSIHKELASVSIIPIPSQSGLNAYTAKVKKLNMAFRIALTNKQPRKNIAPKPLPERIGEPSVFKHVVYIIKENKTYDQVFGDIKNGRGEQRLCIYGDSVTPNQHQLASDFSLLDNYYASGKSSAEGHQWTDAAMVSDYIERNVRAWFRSYPHRQEDALVYNKNGFIWNNALDHGKKVRIYGEACLTGYDNKLNWLDIYNKYVNNEPIERKNTSTIARIRPIISPDYPDCDNINFTDQLRADVFIKEWHAFEQLPGDGLPALMVLSMPDDHTAGTSPGFPEPKSMVADNDLAFGRIIDVITHSRFWDSTVVFVTEDDSQSGWDHISSYRTTSLIISPYSVLNKTIHTNYNQTSMVRTIEQILGIPPMNIMDATALPMFDCFSNTKTAYTYNHTANRIPLNQMNKPFAQLKGRALYYAKLSANAVFKEVDGGEDDLMNRILWFSEKGNQKYPVNTNTK